jgi:hypothetical protein
MSWIFLAAAHIIRDFVWQAGTPHLESTTLFLLELVAALPPLGTLLGCWDFKALYIGHRSFTLYLACVKVLS